MLKPHTNTALKTIPGSHGDAIAATTQFATYDAADENWTGRKGHIDLTAKQWKTPESQEPSGKSMRSTYCKSK